MTERRGPDAGVARPPRRAARVWRPLLGVAVLATLPGTSLPLAAQWTASVTVAESAGIRRTAFPTSARLEVPEGRLGYVSQVRLLDGTAEVPSQGTAWSHWPDGSIRDLEVDFNVSLAPRETRSLEIRYGADVTAGAANVRGLAVEETDRTLQAGGVTLNKGGYTFIASIAYREELIGQGRNGFAVVERSGIRRDPREIRWEPVEILKGGPLRVLARYRGRLTLSGGSEADIVLDAELPSSKSWLKLSVRVSDPDGKIGDLGFETPLRLGAYPWTWDFATPNDTYGAFRDPTGSAVFERTLDADGRYAWEIRAGASGAETPYETGEPEAGDRATWAHFVGPDEAVAIVAEEGTGAPGTLTMWLTGTGQTTVRFRSAEPVGEHALTVYQHYVATPVAIGAATSPASIAGPLSVTVE